MRLINNEAKQNRLSPFNPSRMQRRYKTTSGLFTFPEPTLEVIENNVFFLLRNSKLQDFQGKYRYRPSYLSQDEYGTLMLDKLLMYTNGVYTIEEFDMDKVRIPLMGAIVKICRQNFSDDEINLTEVTW